MATSPDSLFDINPQWYKDAVIYQLHPKAFHDANGDGKGDFSGMIAKLDYLQSLGVSAIWLLPFFPSPLRDDGYDIADYYSVHPQYDTLKEFKIFLREAHKRELRVIIELVINHTSDQHPWFQRARRAKPGSVHRDYYVWSDTARRYEDARIIFQDFETSNWTWDSEAQAYYWHRFYSHQPDLNFENPRVRKEVFKVLDFWLGMGVDGVRLDAIPYLFEREGTNCENLPETHDFLKQLRTHVDENYDDKMLLAEANQWPEDAVAYFGDGDECHMCFHFPIMPRMFMAVQMEDRFPLIDILDQTPEIPETSQWAIFLRNHDELTLEMVTDEERDYMYRVYARDPRARINLGIRRRLAPLMRNNRRKIELMNFLLFSLPGTPIIYYGDEIGMGDNYYLGDRDGVRTPMQWSPDRNAGFSRANPQKLYLPVVIEPEYHYEAVNVENQDGNLSSLLWWMRRMIAMRQQYKAFGRGRTVMLNPDNPKVLAFLREYENERILVVVNLSRFAQVVQLDLSDYAGLVPEEVFSRNSYPVIQDRPYLLTLGVHDHYWFELQGEEDRVAAAGDVVIKLRANQTWRKVVDGTAGDRLLKEALPGFFQRAEWFRGKGRKIRGMRVVERIPVDRAGGDLLLVMVNVTYRQGDHETYLLPLAWRPEAEARALLDGVPEGRLATVVVGGESGVLLDALYSDELRTLFLDLMGGRRRLKGQFGELSGVAGKQFRALRKRTGDGSSRVLNIEQSNSSLIYGDTFFLKLYRVIEAGPNPDVEITRFLTERMRLDSVPPFAGEIVYRSQDGATVSAGLLQGYVPNQGDAWTFALHHLVQFIDRLVDEANGSGLSNPPEWQIDRMGDDERSVLHSMIGPFELEMITTLGQRTGEMHLALASDASRKEWQPEAFSSLYQRSIYQSMRSTARRTLITVQKRLDTVSPSLHGLLNDLLARQDTILDALARVRGAKVDAKKIRVHGDYHLGQVLFTGKDFVIIDFEGEPRRKLSERRLKRSPLRDVASMIRSLHYAAVTARDQALVTHTGEKDALDRWLHAWFQVISERFIAAYVSTVEGAGLIPEGVEPCRSLLHGFLIERAVYELGWELHHRPDWLHIPAAGLYTLLEGRWPTTA